MRSVTWCLALQFLFHLSEFGRLLLQRFLQICTAQLKEPDFSQAVKYKNTPKC